MVLELIIIGGVVYYYVRKNKDNKARKAAFIKGEPFRNRDGTISYPPDYPGLPPYTANDMNVTRAPPSGDYKFQQPQQLSRSIPIETSEMYRDEKAPLYSETREVMREKM